MEHKILLVQEPKISHEIKKIGALVTERLAELNLEDQVITADTVKAMKELKATLNKELDEFEVQRKTIKNKCLQPYSEMEDIYKVEIAEKYKSGIDTLKTKIDDYDNKLKDEKEEELKAYFIELCEAEEIDFVTFDKVGLNITLSASMKSYKETIQKFIQKICNDIDMINAMEDSVEIMAEYKVTLDASKAVTDHKARKEREQAEKDRIRNEMITRRVSQLYKLGASFDEMTKVYYFDDNHYISKEELEELTKEDFDKLAVETYNKYLSVKESEKEQEPESKEPETAEALKAPEVEQTEKIVTASFQVFGTHAQLKSLGQYMREHNINYKNI